MRNSRGFTLIEIIVAVALVAILSAAIAPSVLNNISQGRMARAQSDVQAIASAVMRFKADTGKFPRLVSGAKSDTSDNRIDFLASAGSGLTAGFPTGVNWPTTLTTLSNADKSCEDITSHLILGKSRGMTDSLYVRATNPDDATSVGFKSTLLSSDPLDPWGNRYIVTVKALGEIGKPCWVVSAGPNGLIDTAILANGTGAATALAADDIGFRIQ